MSTVLLPSLNIDIAIKTFSNLSTWFILAKDKSVDFYSGLQEGYILCVADMFGHGTDLDADNAVSNKTTWTHVLDEIVHGKMGEWLEKEDLTIKDLKDLEQASEQATREYASEHPYNILTALRSI